MFAIYRLLQEVDDIADNLRDSKALKRKKINLWKKRYWQNFLKIPHWIQV